jgi:glycosyltransferase involved in cell wall biosynthesis
MRIAILCPSFGEYGGIGRIAEALGREFLAHGHELAIVTRPSSRPVPTALTGSPRLEIAMHQLPRRWRHLAKQARLGALLLRSMPELRRFLEGVRTDVVLTLAISTFAPIGIIASRWFPVLVSLQGGEPDGAFAAHPRIFRRLLQRASGITACASSLRTQAIGLAPATASKIEVIPNGVDVSFFAAQPAFAYDRPYLLAAGRFTPQKGFDVLLRAAARIPSIRSGRVHLLVAGDGGEADALRRQVDRLDLACGVRFLGAVDAQRLASLYRGARGIAVPSRWEGLPLVCLEAMASGRPVVASRVDGIPDAVIDQETGFLVDPNDAPALADALETLLHDPARGDRLGASGETRARARFAWQTIAGRYLSLLERIVRHP